MWRLVAVVVALVGCGGCVFSLSWSQKADAMMGECDARGGFWEVQYDKQVRPEGYRCVPRPPRPKVETSQQ